VSIPRFIRRVRAMLKRPDMRERPVKGLFRRVVWRLRWAMYPNEPWMLRVHDAMPFLVARGGAGALIYYQGASEPETADFIKRVLKPGMVFVDAGAHLGEYTVLAGAILHSSGCVHAFEPRPDVFELLLQNVQLNHCQNVVARRTALWHERGVLEFELTPEPSTSALRIGRAARAGSSLIKVQAETLDRYFDDIKMAKPSLIKVDVEGAELHVLRGAQSLLAQGAERAPVLIVECEPPNLERFGCSFVDVYGFLRELGYGIYAWRQRTLVPVDASSIMPGGNFIAAKISPRISASPD
jgi:FkbM family methyltransferase